MSDEQLKADVEEMRKLAHTQGNPAHWLAFERIRARLEAQPDRQAVATAIDVALKGTLLQAEAFDAADAAIAAIRGDTK